MDFSKLFIESKGEPITYKGKKLIVLDKIPLSGKKAVVQITFLSTKSELKQGIMLLTKGEFEVNGQTLPNKTILWEYSAPKTVNLSVKTKDKLLIIYNVWKTEVGGITHYWSNGGAMYVEETDDASIYHCNDGVADEDFDDLVFELKIWDNT